MNNSNNVTPTNIIRGSAGTNPVNLALGSIYSINIKRNYPIEGFTSSQFVWYILSVLFLPAEHFLKLLLSSYQISPYTPMSYPLFQLFLTKIHCPISIDVAMKSILGKDKLYIHFDDIVILYTKMPIIFQEYIHLKNEIRHMVGEEICKRIEYRKANIHMIQEHLLKYGQLPKESCCSSLKRYFYHLPPLYQYDFSIPQDKVESTLDQVIRYNCSLYYPKISTIHKNLRNSLSTSFSSPSYKDKVSDASKPKCNRSVRSSLKNKSTLNFDSAVVQLSQDK